MQGPIEPSSQISFIGSTLFPLASVGYEQNEFFLSGTADSYTSASPLAKDGRWHVSVATKSPYTTRIVVYRPADPKRFDGTVVVEWLNVTGGVDAAAAWLQSHDQMIRDGMAYVGVDAQAGGINGEAGSLAAGAEPGGGSLKATDPAPRYGSLDHPGDSYAYSIYQQVGNAIHADGATILSGLDPKHVMALGESQSAWHIPTYIDALQKTSPGIYDAYFVYSRSGNAADLSEAPLQTVTAPTPTYIRTDLHVPVFLFETETDLFTLGYLAARQPATADIREWEVAGTAHDDSYGLLYSRSDAGDASADTDAFDSMLDPSADPIPGIVSCSRPINTGSHTYELRAAMEAVNRWMATGTPPPQSPRLEVARDGTHFVTDAEGNARRGHPHPPGHRTGGQTLRTGTARHPGGDPAHTHHHVPQRERHLLHLRDHRPLQPGQARLPLPHPRRLREQMGRCRCRPREGGLPPPTRRRDPRPGGGPGLPCGQARSHGVEHRHDLGGLTQGRSATLVPGHRCP